MIKIYVVYFNLSPMNTHDIALCIENGERSMSQIKHCILESLVKYGIVFAAAMTAAAIVGKVIVSDATFAPISPNFGTASPIDEVGMFAAAARNPAIELLIIFVSARSAYIGAVSVGIAAWRGAALGYTSALVSYDRIIFDTPRALLGIGCPDYLFPFAVYIAICAAVVCFSSVMTAFSRSDNVSIQGGKLFLLMLVLSGFAAVLSVIGTLCI